MRNLEGVAQSLDSESGLRKLELIERLYRSLDDKLRSKLEAFLPPDQWSFKTFMQFLSKKIMYVDAMHAMKIGLDIPPVTKTCSKLQWNPSLSRQTKELQIAFNDKFGKNGAKRLHSGQCVLHPKSLQHSLTECRKFQSLKVAERWNIVKDHGLCFNRFAVNHYIRNCRLKSCRKCLQPHHKLLHNDRPNHADLSSDVAVSLTPSQGKSWSDLTTVGELQDEDDRNEQVCLMLLTAVKHDDGGHTCEHIPFYAAIDNEATRTLCSN